MVTALIKNRVFIIVWLPFVLLISDGRMLPKTSEILGNSVAQTEESHFTQRPHTNSFANDLNINFDSKSENANQVNPANLAISSQAGPAVANNTQKTPLPKQNAYELWDTWKKHLQQGTLQQIPIVNALLADRLRKQSEPEIYQDIDDILASMAYPIEVKALLLDLLSETAVPESLAELLKLAEAGPESPLYAFVLQAIANIGDNRWDGRFHEELSPPLETVWSNPKVADESYLSAVGTAIAEIGAPTGVTQLIKSVSGNSTKTSGPKQPAIEPSLTDQQASETLVGSMSVPVDEQDRTKQQIAFETLPDHVHNPNSTPVLADCLAKENVGTPTSDVCSLALAEINAPGATQVLVDHLQNAVDADPNHIKDVLNKIDDQQSLDIIAATPSLNLKISTDQQTADDYIGESQILPSSADSAAISSSALSQ